jgi:hypothetical protein
MRECVTGMEWTLNYRYIRDYNIYSDIREIIEEAKCCKLTSPIHSSKCCKLIPPIVISNGQCIINVVDQVEAKTRLHKRMVDICANVEVVERKGV